jgi:hypothetical protein
VRKISCFGSFFAAVCGGVVFIGACGFAIVGLQTIFAALAGVGANEIKVSTSVADNPILVILFIA